MDKGLITDVLISLILVIFVLLACRRLKIPPILGYLITGIIVGPGLTGLLASTEQMHFLAELGVVFLLFSLGLEFSLPKMMAMKGLVFGLGTAQVTVTTLIIACGAVFFGASIEQALIIGVAIALSSTAIVIRQLSEQHQTNSMSGQMAIAVLLFQDLAVVPVLIVVPMLGSDNDLGLSLLFALFKGVGAFIVLFFAGKWLLPKLFDEIARARSDELFVLTTLLIVVLTGALTYSLGLSAALGAFLSGMMLGESKYRHQLDADIRPFRDILMGVFFVSIGMMLDLIVIGDNWVILLVLLPLIVLIKALVIAMIYFHRKVRRRSALKSGIYLAQIGEFGFVVLSLAQQNMVLESTIVSLIIALGVLSMGLTPLLMHYADKVAKYLISNKELLTVTVPKIDAYADSSEHVVICGFGRVGQTVARFLKTEAIPCIAIERDPVRLQEAMTGGENVLFGDGRNRDILKNLAIDKAKLVIITFNDFHATMQVLDSCLALAPDVKVLIRTRDDSEMSTLQKAGAAAVVPEILEGSLMLVSQVLFMSGVPMSRVLKRIQIERKNHYQFMHGFFHGDESSHAMDVELEQLHAVALPSHAFVVGLRIDELPMTRLRVELRGIRRDNQELSDPDVNLVIAANDVLVLCGKPRRVERAESYLLNG